GLTAEVTSQCVYGSETRNELNGAKSPCELGPRAQLPDQVAIARSFPMQLKRRGVELRLIVGDHHRSAAIVDLSLLKAVARAYRWFDEISTGRARSLAAIAAREGLAVRYVGRLI